MSLKDKEKVKWELSRELISDPLASYGAGAGGWPPYAHVPSPITNNELTTRGNRDFVSVARVDPKLLMKMNRKISEPDQQQRNREHCSLCKDYIAARTGALTMQCVQLCCEYFS